MKCSRKLWYLSSIPVMALMATSAMAQQTTAAPTQAAATAPAQDEQPTGVEDIVVTAQRRNQNQQDVPISVTTVTAAAAERQGVTGTETLTAAVPALQFSRQTGNGGAPFIRGVGSSESTAGAEGSVALYVDDVYVGSGAATLFDFNNIQSIEVLKGPQGTLFGRNATGGVVNIHTRLPSQTPSLDAKIGYGSYDAQTASLYATRGLSDTVAVNFSAAYRDQNDGFGHNLVNGEDTLLGHSRAFRGQLLWTPSTATELLLTAEYSKRKDDIGMSVGIFPGTVAVGGGTYVDPFGTFDTPGDSSLSETKGVSAKLRQDFGDLKFVSITAYRATHMDWRLDGDGSPTGAVNLAIRNNVDDDAFSQEFQLQSPEGERFNWILGAYYYHAESSYSPNGLTGTTQAAVGGFRNLFSSQDLDSYSAFADGTYKLMEDTNLTVGIRYTTDEILGKFTVVNGLGTTVTPDSKRTFSSPTWRVVLDHKFTPNILGYASYSRGFKSGRFNLTGAGSVEPEEIDAYEIGVKSDLFDRRLRINASTFYYDYRDLQVSTVIPGGSQILNAASAKIKGADLDFNFVPNSYVNISGGLSLLDTEYVDFPAGPLLVANPAVCTPTPATTGTPTGGFRTCPADLSGNHLTRSPEWTLSLLGTFTLPLDGGAELALNVSYYHNDGFFWEPDNHFAQPSYDLVGAGVTWTSPDQKYDVRVFGKNLLDEYYYNYVSSGGLRAAFSPAMPRNFGIEVGVHF